MHIVNEQFPAQNNISTTIKWLITFTVMLATTMEILDMTIVNVALPTMMGELGATTEQITWILTSYIVSAAIVMPLTGFLVARIGRKKLLLINIIGFMLASALCGAATSLTELVIFRTCQGIFGASMIPLSQYILNSIFSKEESAKAMAIWGIGIMVAPILGPTLGGYITNALNWRWVFYINIPISVLAFILTAKVIPETKKVQKETDWLGLILLAVSIGALQIFLDRGNINDWFASKLITLLLVIWVMALLVFIIRGINKKDNIINLQLFKNKNFTIATIMMLLFAANMFALITLIPLMAERLFNYSTELTGLFILPRAIAAGFSMALTTKLLKKYDGRKIIFLGIVLNIYGAYLMTKFNLNASFAAMMWPNIVSGFSNGFFFVPISTIALSTLEKNTIAEGSGLFNFGRSIGSSIGISIIGTYFARRVNINWQLLAGHLQLTNPALKKWLYVQHATTTTNSAITKLNSEIINQSTMLAFTNAFWLTTTIVIMIIPLLFLLKTATVLDKK